MYTPRILDNEAIQTGLWDALKAPIVSWVSYERPHIGIPEEVSSSWHVYERVIREIWACLDDTNAEWCGIF